MLDLSGLIMFDQTPVVHPFVLCDVQYYLEIRVHDTCLTWQMRKPITTPMHGTYVTFCAFA